MAGPARPMARAGRSCYLGGVRTHVFAAGVFILLLLICGCTIVPKGSDDGGGGAGGGSGGSDGGSNDGGGSSDDCSDKPCDACRQCASEGPCEDEVDACLANTSCVAIDECLAFCGATPAECFETCRAQNPNGAIEYDAARSCLDCDHCEDACAASDLCGG